MKLKLKDIENKHREEACVVAAHGPSLDNTKLKIEEQQKKNMLLRISVNEWFDFFKQKPDYWIVSNSEFTIKASMTNDPLWQHRQYPHDVFNKYKIPIFVLSGLLLFRMIKK